MILAVDIGNTNICIGGLDGRELRFTFRMVTRPRCTPDEYTAELRFLLRRVGFDKADCTGPSCAAWFRGSAAPLRKPFCA